MTLWRLFYTMVGAGLASVGGSQVIIALAQSAWVGPGMLSPGAFAFAVALGQLTPGPVSVLVVALGWEIAGIVGAAVALIGITLPTWAAGCIAARGLERYRQVLAPFLAPALWVVAALALHSGIKMTLPLHPTWPEYAAVGLFALVAASGKVEVHWIVLAGAALGLLRMGLPLLL